MNYLSEVVRMKRKEKCACLSGNRRCIYCTAATLIVDSLEKWPGKTRLF